MEEESWVLGVMRSQEAPRGQAHAVVCETHAAAGEREPVSPPWVNFTQRNHLLMSNDGQKSPILQNSYFLCHIILLPI